MLFLGPRLSVTGGSVTANGSGIWNLKATCRIRPVTQPGPIMAVWLGQEPPDSKLLKEISGLDINAMTPLEALTKLYELQKKAREGD